MSDKTEREYRQNMLTILNRFYRGRGGSLLTKDECEAMEYAISSIKTDLKYDLLYEETKHIADTDKMKEPTTKNDLPKYCDRNICLKNEYNNIGCDDCEVTKSQEPTTKNDLGVASELEKNSKKLEKDFGELDCISRAEVLKLMQDNWHTHNGDWAMQESLDDIRALPSVTPQEPRCKNCKWWKDSDGEYRRGCGAESQCPINRREVFEGDGYCFLFEPQADKE